MPDRPLAIGIDGRELQGRPTGTGRYLRNILRAWPEEKGDRLFVYCAGRLPEDPLLTRPGTVARARGSGRERHAWWTERHLARAAEADGVDVLFCPAYTCPLTVSIPRVTAVHDMSMFAWPQDFGTTEGVRRRLLTSASIRVSRGLLACSEFTRAEIARFFPDQRSRVTTAPLAAADDLPPAPSRADARTRLAARGPVLLSVGTIFNRRRLPVLLRAVAILRRAWPGLVLEVVGENRTTPRLDVERLLDALGLRGSVRVSGFVSDAGLVARYAAADLVVYLSEYEGFGLPVLEAMVRGVPVVAGRRPALTEMFAPAARLVDPGNEDEVAGAIEHILRDGHLRADLVRRGYALAPRFSWVETARQTRRALARAAAGR